MKLLNFIIKPFKSESSQVIILTFIIWRVSLFLVLSLAIILIPLYSQNFLGGGLENYLENPYLFAWANFDGEHYLSIAQAGYKSLTHSFFPLYPMMVKLISFFSYDLNTLVWIGLIISNISFLLAIIYFWKLVRLDFSLNVAFYSICALVVFPTSFYFGSFYTGSLFLLLSVSSFYCARVGKWWWAGILAGFSSAARINGILLLPVLFLEWWLAKKRPSFMPLLLIPLGLLTYMFYLYQTTGNFLTFYTELSVFGPQRQGNFVILPQVFYRYFNILLTVSHNNLIYWTVIVELITAVSFVIILLWGVIKKIRPSYLLYALISFILPTLTGSFSSLPRYILLIFPLFLILGIFLSERSKLIRSLFLLFMIILLMIEASLFLRGYWVA